MHQKGFLLDSARIKMNRKSTMDLGEGKRFAMVPHSFIEEAKNMSHQTRWLYVALVYYRNTQTGDAFPTYETIRKLTRLTRDKISKGFKDLLERGWIEDKRTRFGGSTFYRVNLKKRDEIEEESCR